MADDDKELKDQRVVTMMTPSELEAIDDWMFKNRIRSRGEAIRRLCQVGLLMNENVPATLDRSSEVTAAIFDWYEEFDDLVSEPLEIMKAKAALSIFERLPKLTDLQFDHHNRLVLLAEQADIFSGGQDFEDCLNKVENLKAAVEKTLAELREANPGDQSSRPDEGDHE